MRLSKIQVNNFRMLKELDLDLEENLSLVIGKNNCGKTSLLSVLDKFIGGKSSSNNFTYDDFNTSFKTTLFKTIEDNGTSWGSLQPKGIELYLFIRYEEKDNISNIRPLFFDLDPNNNMVILKFEYALEPDRMMSLIEAFNNYYARFKSNPKCKKTECFDIFIKERHRRYFQIYRKAVRYDVASNKASEGEYKLFDTTSPLDLSKILSFKYISARRDIENKDNDGTLSSLSERYYEKTKPDEESAAIQKFEDALLETDVSLTEIYQGLFDNVIEKVKRFGGIRENETIVKFISTLSQQQLLKGNTTVVYEADNCQLPESYNGLGYLNLISIIIEIETLLSEFRNDKDSTALPADINLLFVEEPEAHTHPQMQYIFIKNIKNLLQEGSSGADGKKRIDLQTVITTHSSHIVAECDFDDIKYFQRMTPSSVISKNLKDLEVAYKNEKDPKNTHFKFLKQYLTLNYAEIFFADKAILYEGEAEHILLPAMMKKIDEEEHDEKQAPLLSQNISLIESGAYAQIFDKFLSFIGIKTLIITDIDSGQQVKKTDKNGVERTVAEACSVDDGTLTTNGALKHYYEVPLAQHKDCTQLAFFTNMRDKDKVLIKRDEKWVVNPDGNLMLIFQTKGADDYYPRSFEDAFLQVNRLFIINNLDAFISLKKKSMVEQKSEEGEYQFNPYDLAKECIDSKASFALDVLLNSEKDVKRSYSNWETPSYIKEGLLWLRNDLEAKS